LDVRKASAQAAHRVLKSLRFEYRRPHRVAGGRPLPYYVNVCGRVPQWLAREVALSGRRCTVPLDAIIAPPAFSYAANGWHPYSETLAEYQRSPTHVFSESTLAKVYTKFLPQSAHEALFATGRVSPQVLHQLPPRFAGHEWFARKHEIDLALRGQPPIWMVEGHRVFGPVSDEYARADYSRLISVHNGIARHGYRPDLAADPISGFFLIYDKDFRLRLTAGQHRIASMKVLGYQQVRVQLALPIAVSIESISLREPTVAWASSVDDVRVLLSEQVYEQGWNMARRWSLQETSRDE